MTLTLLTAFALLVATVASAATLYYIMLGTVRFVLLVTIVAKGGGKTIHWVQPLLDGLFTGGAAFIAILAWTVVL